MPVHRLLYSLICYLVFPAVLLRLFWRSRKNATIREHWQQRLGFITLQSSSRIWLHAVSVGETVAARPLVERLLTDFPNHKLLISNTTATGYQTSLRLFGDCVEHCYFPYDLNGSVARFLNRSAPSLLVVMETEIWPNLLYQCKQRKIPVLIANARLSERSTKGYSRIYSLIKPTINSTSMIACRSTQDADNFMRLGANPERLTVAGNIKFDIKPASTETGAGSLKQQLKQDSKVWVAASTHAGEDEIILDCYAKLKASHPDLVLVLVPRHPERFDSVYELCTDHGVTERRSNRSVFTHECEIILGDSMGEMDYWYASANVVFMGGSFVDTGGHNPLEASMFGAPVISGPAIFNFNDVYEVLCKNGVAWIALVPESLTSKLDELLQLPNNDILKLRQRSIETLKANKGATSKLIRLCKELIA